MTPHPILARVRVLLPRPSRRVNSFFGALCLGVAASAQPLAVDPGFAPVLSDETLATTQTNLQPTAAGGFLAHGRFAFVDGEAANGVARLTAAGARDATFSFAGDAPGYDDRIVALADGRVLVIRSLYDTEANTGYARFERHLPDGSLDATFTPYTIPAGYVRTVVPTHDGRHIIGGHFATIAGQPREGLARLAADGTVDLTFAPVLLGPTTVVASLAVDANGEVIATAYSTHPAPFVAFLGRFHADGSRDQVFFPALELVPGTFYPEVLAGLPDGKVLLQGFPAVRLNANGTFDATFAPAVPDGHVIIKVVARTDGRLLVETGPAEFLSPRATNVRLLDADGALLVDFAPAFPADHALQLHTTASNGDVIIRDGRWYWPVWFDVFASSAAIEQSVLPVRPLLTNARFSRVTLAGERDAMFAPVLATPGNVQQLAPASTDDGVIVSGGFTRVNGMPRPGLARLRSDGSLDPAFAPPESGGPFTLALTQPDGALLVYGPMTEGAASPKNRTILRLLSDGTIDPTLPADSDLAASGAHVHAIDGAGRIIASLEGATVVERYLARFAADGELLETLPTLFTFDLPIIATNTGDDSPAASVIGARFNAITEVQPQSDGGMLVAGRFRRVAGQPVPGLVRLLADGTVDASYQPTLPFSAEAFTSTLLSGGRALVTFAGAAHSAGHARTVRLRRDGTIDPLFRPAPGDTLYYAREQFDGTFLSVLGRFARWTSDGVRDLNDDLTFGVGADFSVAALAGFKASDGTFLVGGAFTQVNTVARTGLARLRPVATPGITVQPVALTIFAGRTASFQVAIGDLAAATYQWQLNGTDIAGANRALLVLDHVTASDAGLYRVIITVGGQTYTSDAVALTVNRGNARLVNFSARSRVRPGAPPQIAGFITASAAPRQVLLRAMGRGLQWDQPLHSLPRPALGLFTGPNRIAYDEGSANRPEILAVSDRVGAFRPGFAWPFPFNDDDSALVRDLPAGIYTAQTAPADDGAGVSLFEFYDAGPTPAVDFVRNVSLRGHTAPGVDTMIGGFVIAGDGPLTLLLRAVGPELAQWEVPDFLANPRVRLHTGAQLIAFNDNWDEGPVDDVAALLLASEETGAFPLHDGSTSAALLVQLEPGAYTIHATGTDSTPAGEVLLEIYVVGD